MEQKEQKIAKIFKRFGIQDFAEDVSRAKGECEDELLEEVDNLIKESEGFEDISCSEEEFDRFKDGIPKCDDLEELEELNMNGDNFEDISDYGTDWEGGLNAFPESDRLLELKKNDIVPYELAQSVLNKYEFCYLDSPNTGKLHKFNGRVWEPIPDLTEIELLVYGEMDEEDKMEQKNIRAFCRKVVWFIQYECMEQYKSGNRFSEEDFRMVENRIVFQNCVYDAQTDEILHHDSSLPYYIEISAEYMEEDIFTGAYDKLKTDATQDDKDSMKMFDNMLGYLMVPNRTGKCYFVMGCARDSGKSIFGQFIESIYCGNRVKTVNLEHLSGRFSLSDSDSMVLLSGLEAETDRLDMSVAAQIKRITGEDKIRIETKYKSEVTAKIRFKLLLATNGGMILEKNVKDDAFYRRTIVIPFLRSVSMKNMLADMPEMLQQEKSEILSKAARSLHEIIRPDGGIIFPESKMSKMIKRTWTGNFEFEMLFFDKILLFTGKPEDALPKEDIYEQYRVFFQKGAAPNPINAVMCTKDELMRKISKRFPGSEQKKLRRSSMDCPYDIRLRPCMTGLRWKNEGM